MRKVFHVRKGEKILFEGCVEPSESDRTLSESSIETKLTPFQIIPAVAPVTKRVCQSELSLLLSKNKEKDAISHGLVLPVDYGEDTAKTSSNKKNFENFVKYLDIRERAGISCIGDTHLLLLLPPSIRYDSLGSSDLTCIKRENVVVENPDPSLKCLLIKLSSLETVEEQPAPHELSNKRIRDVQTTINDSAAQPDANGSTNNTKKAKPNIELVENASAENGVTSEDLLKSSGRNDLYSIYEKFQALHYYAHKLSQLEGKSEAV